MAKRTTNRGTKPKASQRRKGLRPGEYRKRSTVFVERMRSADEQARYVEDNLYTTDAYIVITHRDDGHWTHTVELHGEMMRLPGKIVERLTAQKDAIIREQRSDRAKDRHETLAAQALADQVEAEAERAADLEGL
jgi:hypothetical protein